MYSETCLYYTPLVPEKSVKYTEVYNIQRKMSIHFKKGEARIKNYAQVMMLGGNEVYC